jgi:hypothetical protein
LSDMDKSTLTLLTLMPSRDGTFEKFRVRFSLQKGSNTLFRVRSP